MFWQCLGDVLAMFWRFVGHVLATSWGCSGHVFGHALDMFLATFWLGMLWFKPIYLLIVFAVLGFLWICDEQIWISHIIVICYKGQKWTAASVSEWTNDSSERKLPCMFLQTFVNSRRRKLYVCRSWLDLGFLRINTGGWADRHQVAPGTFQVTRRRNGKYGSFRFVHCKSTKSQKWTKSKGNLIFFYV